MADRLADIGDQPLLGGVVDGRSFVKHLRGDQDQAREDRSQAMQDGLLDASFAELTLELICDRGKFINTQAAKRSKLLLQQAFQCLDLADQYTA